MSACIGVGLGFTGRAHAGPGQAGSSGSPQRPAPQVLPRSAPAAAGSVQATVEEGPRPTDTRAQIERVGRGDLRDSRAFDLRWARWQLLDAETLSDPRSAGWTLGGPGGVDPLTGTWDPARGFGDGALSGSAGGSAILGAFGAMATSGWACVERLANGRAIRRHFVRTFMRRGAVMLSWRVDF